MMKELEKDIVATIKAYLHNKDLLQDMDAEQLGAIYQLLKRHDLAHILGVVLLKNPENREKYKELAQRPIPLAELKKYPLILMEKGTIARRTLDTFLGSLGVDLQPSIEVGSWDLMKRLVHRGMGVGLIPREYAVRRLEEKTLFEVKTDPALPVRSVGMLLKKNAPVSYALHSFLENVQK